MEGLELGAYAEGSTVKSTRRWRQKDGNQDSIGGE